MATKKAVEAANTAENNEPLNSIAKEEKNEARPGNESTVVSEGESIYTINEFAKAAATAPHFLNTAISHWQYLLQKKKSTN